MPVGFDFREAGKFGLIAADVAGQLSQVEPVSAIP